MSVTYSIQVSLPVLKTLTAHIEEGQTYDDVLRDLLGLNAQSDSAPKEEYENWLTKPLPETVEHLAHELSGKGGFFSRGLWLPNGTELRARYKQHEFRARIANNSWLDADGRRHASPSAAATAITDTSVNGLRFWEAKRPDDTIWRRLDALVKP
jgi:hypothetical protein